MLRLRKNERIWIYSKFGVVHYSPGTTRGFQVGHSLPRIYSLSGWDLLKDAAMFCSFAFLRVAI